MSTMLLKNLWIENAHKFFLKVNCWHYHQAVCSGKINLEKASPPNGTCPFDYDNHDQLAQIQHSSTKRKLSHHSSSEEDYLMASVEVPGISLVLSKFW